MFWIFISVVAVCCGVSVGMRQLNAALDRDADIQRELEDAAKAFAGGKR